MKDRMMLDWLKKISKGYTITETVFMLVMFILGAAILSMSVAIVVASIPTIQGFVLLFSILVLLMAYVMVKAARG